MIEAYPLYWPEGRKRTSNWNRSAHPAFKGTFAKYRDHLLRQVELLGGAKVILSTNVGLRNDGLPYANLREPEDSGVALYFDYKKKPMCFAADHYKHTRQNIHAIALTIQAIRAIERYGASDMMERAFRGFTALPENAGESWRTIFGFSATESVTEDRLESEFRKLAFSAHPDHGGDTQKFQQLSNARKDARRFLGLTA